MPELPATFRSFRIHADGGHRAGMEMLSLDQLTAGEVVIRVQYSSINYKDALAATGRARILRNSPLNGGIDLAGTVISSTVAEFAPGAPVLVTGSGLSEIYDGGYSEIARVPAEHVIAVPKGLELIDTMRLGTAGFTAALALYRLESVGLKADAGPVLVTGATGGVGSLAIQMLARAGFEVHALTSKESQFDYLRGLGAVSCVSTKGLVYGGRPLESALYAGAIDNIGGETLSWLTRVVQPFGAIASCGNAGGIEVHTTVMPFIIRGLSLLGINSATTGRALRQLLWGRLATAWRPPSLAEIAGQSVELGELDAVFEALIAGRHVGRTVVRVAADAAP